MITPTIVVFANNFNRLTCERLKSRLYLCKPNQVVEHAIRYIERREPTNESLNELGEDVRDLLSDDVLEQSNEVRRGSVQLIFIASLDDVASLHRAHYWAQKAIPYLRSLPYIPEAVQFERIGLFLSSPSLEEREKTDIKQQLVKVEGDASSSVYAQPVGSSESKAYPQQEHSAISYAGQYAWLREVLYTKAFDYIFLLTSSNYDPAKNPQGFTLLQPEEVEDLAIELVSHFAATDVLNKVDQVIAGAVHPPIFCSAGVTSIFFPASALVKQLSSKFTAQLITHYTTDDKPSSDAEVLRFLTDNDLTYQRICEQLMATSTPGETVINRLHFPSLIFRAIPLESLPERIASYGDFLARERVRFLIRQIDDNLEKLKQKGLNCLKQKVDGLVAHPQEPSTVKALDFLKRLWNKLKEDRDYAALYLSPEKLEELYGKFIWAKKSLIERLIEELLKPSVKLPSEQECHDRLVRALKNRPLWLPVLARYGLLGLVIAYGVQLIVGILSKHPFLVNIGIFANPIFWFYPVWGLFVLAGVLTVLQSLRIIRRRAVDYQNAILRRLRGIVYAHLSEAVHKFYDHLLSHVGDPEPAEAPEGSERRKVQDFVASLHLAARELNAQEVQFPASLFCISALEHLDPRLRFHYKDNPSINWDHELRECGRRGFFVRWRKTVEGEETGKDLNTLIATLQQYGEEGFGHVYNYSLLQLLQDHGRTQPQELWRLLQNRSYFYLSLSSLPQAPVRMVLYAHSDEQRLNNLFQVGDNIHRLHDNDKFRLGSCQVIWGYPLDTAPLIQRWKHDYERCGDKGDLHTVKDWEQLPDPLEAMHALSEKGEDADAADQQDQPPLL